MKIELFNLPKLSLNKWYAGVHWSKRKRIKDKYKILIKSQFKKVLTKNKVYEVQYTFCFKNQPLDASNCVAMLKLIEDIIFEDDGYKIISSINIKSRKSIADSVEINIVSSTDKLLKDSIV